MTTIKDISSVTSSFISNELFIVSGLPSDFSDKNDMTLLLTNFQDGVSMPVQPQCQMQQNLQYSLVVDERYQLLDSEEIKTLSMLSNNSDIDIFEPQKIPILPVQKLNSTEFRPVTHIEIIRPNPSNAKQCTSRRVTGANRVVPMITSMWQKSELTTVEPSLSLMYKTILDDPEEHECELCHDKFLNVIQVEYHMREMHHLHIVMSEQCFVCRKKYVSQQRLKHHIITVHGIQCPELMCKICFMELNTIMEQKAHERKHDKVYACQYCSTKFASEYFCQKHHDEHLVHIKPFQCRICGKRFENGISLSVHGIRHKNLKCSLCNAVFSKEKELLLHVNKYDNEHKNIFLEAIQAQDHEEVQLESMLNVYLKTNSNRLISIEDKAVNDCMEGLLTSVTQTLDTIIKPSNERKGVKCKLCGLKVQSSKELVDHRRTNHLRSCTCLICGKRSPSVSQTWRHMGTHIDKARSTNSSDLQCQICNKLFPTRGKKNFHLERVHKVETVLRLHSCSVCDRKFQHKASRDKHMILHSEEKTAFKCSMCEQVFLRPKFLIRHMAEHEGRNECNICNKTFTRRRQLKLHLSTHSSTGMKNKYKCPTCPTTCQGLAGLKEHLRVHTGERPFACKECDAKFKRVHALKKHMRNVHNEPGAISYPCSFCTMVFNNRGNMLRHVLRIHQGLRRFICGLCGSRYGQNQDLRHHLKMKHELDMPVISCSDKKSVNEIYVLPPIDQLPESHPHAEKINKLVAIEKEKIARFNQVQSSNGTEDESTKPLLPISTAPVSTSIPPVSTVFPPTPSPPPAPLLPPPPPSTLPPPLPLLPSSPPILLPNLTSPSPDISEIQISQKLVTLYRCGVCLIDFLERDLLELHIVETHKIKPALKCDTAVVKPAIPDAPIAKSQLPGTDHSTLNTLSPLTTVLNETTINAASKQISGKTAVTSDCKCSECGKTFGNAARLERHFKTHVGTRPFGCEQCGKHFTEKHNLKVHMRTHTGERPYTCTQCGKQMRYLKDLADHKRQHLGVKPFACSECGAKFLRQRELVRHKMTHSGVKKYQCPTCDKTFTRLDQLKMVHMRCHETSSEPAPFVCTVCNKRFRVKCKLQQHQILHSGVKNHKCVICNKAFALEIYLKSHLKTHQKQHSYVQCPKCPRRFATQQTLLVHDEKFHTRLQKHKEDKKKKIIDMPLLESEIDMTDMDVGLLEDDVLGDKCGAVIYLQMMPELDVPLNH